MSTGETMTKAEAKAEIKQDIAEQQPGRNPEIARDDIAHSAEETITENKLASKKMEEYPGSAPEDVARAGEITNESEQAIMEAKAEAMREMDDVTGEARNEQRDTTPAGSPEKEISRDTPRDALAETERAKPETTSETAVNETKKVYENPEDDPLISGSDKEIQSRVSERVRGHEDEYDTNSVGAERHHAGIRIFEKLAEENPEKMKLYFAYGKEKYEGKDTVPTWYKLLKFAMEMITNKKYVKKLETEFGIREGKKIKIDNRVWIIGSMNEEGLQLRDAESGESKKIASDRLEAFSNALENSKAMTQTQPFEKEPDTKTQTMDEKKKPEDVPTKASAESAFQDNNWQSPNQVAPERAQSGNLGESATQMRDRTGVDNRWSATTEAPNRATGENISTSAESSTNSNPGQQAPESVYGKQREEGGEDEIGFENAELVDGENENVNEKAVATAGLLSAQEGENVESKEKFPDNHIRHPDIAQKIAILEAIDDDGDYKEERFNAYLNYQKDAKEFSVRSNQEKLTAIAQEGQQISGAEYERSLVNGTEGKNTYTADRDGIMRLKNINGSEKYKAAIKNRALQLGFKFE